MPSKKITDAFVRNLTWQKALKPFLEKQKKDPKKRLPTQVAYIHTTERGWALVLVISYGGTKRFRALTYVNSKPKTRGLGTYPAMKVKEARDAARAYWMDPKKADEQADKGTFKDIAQQWIKRHVDENKLRSKSEIERMLKTYVYPKLGNLTFRKIGRLQVNELLDGIVDNHGRSQADAVLAVIRGICNWYASRSEHYVSPIVAQMKRDKRKPKDRARSRFLNDNEIRLVWNAADDCGQFGALVKLALLTGQRRGKLGEKPTAMRWDEISRDGVWTISHDAGEKGTADQIKLPQMALDIIAKQPRIDGNPFVFPGGRKAAFNHFSQGMDELRKKLPDMPRWTLHDLRRTARKFMSRAGVRPDVGELVLGHSIKGIRAVYDDVREYQPMIDHAIQCVANEVDKIINGTEDKNVIPMRR